MRGSYISIYRAERIDILDYKARMIRKINAGTTLTPDHPRHLYVLNTGLLINSGAQPLEAEVYECLKPKIVHEEVWNALSPPARPKLVLIKGAGQ